MLENSSEIEFTIKKERKRLFNFIRKYLPTKEDAEDVLQDVFFQLINSFEEIEYVDRISAWLNRVAKNKIIDLQRKKKNESLQTDKIIFQDEDSEEVFTLADILPDLSGLPDEVYWQNLIWDEIENALNELPEEQREIFLLNEYEGLSFKEIAEIKHEPVNTLLSRKRYAVLYLRKKLRNLYKEL